MQQVMMFGLLMAVFIALAIIGVPVFFAMGLASLVFVLFTDGAVPLNVLASSLVPFFFKQG